MQLCPCVHAAAPLFACINALECCGVTGLMPMLHHAHQSMHSALNPPPPQPHMLMRAVGTQTTPLTLPPPLPPTCVCRYRDPSLPIHPNEITRFPHAVLEVKLSLHEGQSSPAWVQVRSSSRAAAA